MFSESTPATGLRSFGINKETCPRIFQLSSYSNERFMGMIGATPIQRIASASTFLLFNWK